MPLQGMLVAEAEARIRRHQSRELLGIPVGQIVGQMNEGRRGPREARSGLRARGGAGEHLVLSYVRAEVRMTLDHAGTPRHRAYYFALKSRSPVEQKRRQRDDTSPERTRAQEAGAESV